MVHVLIQTESHYPVSRKKIRDTVVAMLNGKVRRSAEVSVNVVGDRQMRRLNKTYRQLDATTDVLSFSQNESTSPMPFVTVPDGVLRLGDVVVSYPQAVAHAAKNNKFVDDVITELVVHGLNHLLGIHHPE